MTTQILNSELSALVSESKRKNTELRNAAEKSLQDLKSLPTTSESQLAADILRRPYFIDPFLIASCTRNAKYASSAAVCFQRLAVSRALPRERLKEVIEALKECTTLGLDIQLKVLQTLPALLQNYSGELRGELLSTVLQICSSLQSSKNPALSNTAAATLQQLVISVFERLVSEDRKALELPTITEVPGGDGPVSVRPVALDAYKIFHDVCVLIDEGKPRHIRFSPIPVPSCLELVESVLTSHAQSVLSHPELGNVLRTILMPYIIRSLSEKQNFPLTVRVIRVLYATIQHHLAVAPSECEIALGLLNHMLDPDASAPYKRALCMEVFRGVYADPTLLLEIYSRYDAAEGKRSILKDNLSVFVRLATEKPALIGLSHQSTVPIGSANQRDPSAEQASTEAGGVSGAIGASIGVSTSNVTGVSTHWSTVKTACMDHLDKNEAPSLPETYIYSLVLVCLNSLSESLAKYILPLTVHPEGRNKKKNRAAQPLDTDTAANGAAADQSAAQGKLGVERTQSYRRRTVPINPLNLDDHPALSGVKVIATLINDCWPAVLASTSTFIYAALDADFYRSLVRAIQKFTQVAGLLRMGTPRDAFLTTLGKAAVPANILAATTSTPATPVAESPSLLNNPKGLLSVDSLVSQASTLVSDRNQRSSLDYGGPLLSTRNLLCLRALLNLAIALGPTLERSWPIIFETLQQADLVMAASHSRPSVRESGRPGTAGSDMDRTNEQTMSSEIAAVEAAATRLFESTVDFPSESFLQVSSALCNILHTPGERANRAQPPQTPQTPISPGHRRTGSYSEKTMSIETQAQDYLFALAKIEQVAKLNLSRYTTHDSVDSGWSLLADELTRVINCPDIPSQARIMASNVLCSLVVNAVGSTAHLEPNKRDEVQQVFLPALLLGEPCDGVRARTPQPPSSGADFEVRFTALECLRAILEHCGDSLTGAWQIVFDILITAFEQSEAISVEDIDTQTTNIAQGVKLLTPKLGRSSFSSLQLSCSDFLSSIPIKCLTPLMDMLFRFCAQQDDLNMSLTTATLFWNVSDFLQNQISNFALDEIYASDDDVKSIVLKIEKTSGQGSLPAIWLSLLLRLTTITGDSREEVRNGAVHTILRIFEHSGDDLTPTVWQLCMRTTVTRMLGIDSERHARNQEFEAKTSNAAKPESERLSRIVKSDIETSKIILAGLGKLVAAYLRPLVQMPEFPVLWEGIVTRFESYLNRGLHGLSTAVYSSIATMLGSVDDPKAVGERPISLVLDLWKSNFPHSSSRLAPERNDKAFEAYLQAFKEIHRLCRASITPKLIEDVATKLGDCVRKSDGLDYSTDEYSMSSAQARVIECLRTIRTDLDGSLSTILKLLASFVSLPFNAAEGGTIKRGLTYIALSKACMDLSKSLIEQTVDRKELMLNEALLMIFGSLQRPISMKYSWQHQGKAPPIWQKATMTALEILEVSLPKIVTSTMDKATMHCLWEQIVLISDGIVSADLSSAPQSARIFDDEKFDTTSFTTLRNLITPALGNSIIPDALRRSYGASLFRASIIHRPIQGEIPNLDAEPLRDLYKVRFGRTRDPEPTLRSRMSYLCFLELISLVSASFSGHGAKSNPSDHDKQIKLAQAAAPYLILRAALPLKTYIADQPLRGRLPQPKDQREELLFVLEKMRELKSEPRAIPEADGVKSEYRKHLLRLFPLITRAVGVAGGDGEADIRKELERLLEGVGEEFGV